MQYTRLGASDIEVSRACLGSMTWGIQNNQADADKQIDYALERGINFIDTAEMYPIPPNKKTQGDTERIIGDWIKRHQQARNSLIIATKITGPGLSYIRDGGAINAASICTAIDDSLARLATDYIDVYQLHWPNRLSPHFGRHWPNQVKPSRTDVSAQKDGMRNILVGLDAAMQQGKIKHWALSDDTPWGIHTFLSLCKEMNIAKPVSIQNEFNLLHTKDWPFLIESCVFENIAYLPWSPLAGGMLSGKYLHDKRPEGSRWTLVQRNGLFRDTSISQKAIEQYCTIAEKYKVTPSQLAIAWCNQVDGVCSTIIGATSMTQLTENIDAFDIELSPECLAEIEENLKLFAMPF